MSGFPAVGERFGDFEVRALLGRGAMGVVFRAHEPSLGRDVALKVIAPHVGDDEEFRTRFRREAQLQASLDSPHVVTVYGVGEIDGLLYLSSQLVDGGDLRARIDREGRLSLGEALTLTTQLAWALDEAHRRGIVHRDVKPQNVLLRTGRPHALLADFGLARSADSDITRSGVVTGTYAYLAPECSDGGAASPASDQYALGCVLVAALTGAAPYAGSDLAVLEAHRSAPVPQVGRGGAVDKIDAVLARMLAKDPRQRFPDLADVAAALQGLPQDDTVLRAAMETTEVRSPAAAGAVASATPPLPRPGRRRGRWLPRAAALGGVAATAAVGTVLALGHAGTTVDTGAQTAATPRAHVSVAPTHRPSPSSPARTPTSARTTRSPSPAARSASPDVPAPSPQPATRAASAAPVPAPAPVSVCWDGTARSAGGTCPVPRGLAGLRWVFPAIDEAESCRSNDESYKVLGWRCTYHVEGGEVAVTYSQFDSWESVDEHYRVGIDHGRAPTPDGDVLRLQVSVPSEYPDQFRSSFYYRRPVPFAATAVGDSPSAVLQGLARALTRHRAIGEF